MTQPPRSDEPPARGKLLSRLLDEDTDLDEVFDRLVSLMNTGQIRPLVSRTYPLAAIQRAQEDFQTKTLPGKLVLIPEDTP